MLDIGFGQQDQSKVPAYAPVIHAAAGYEVAYGE
jgi:hypothetical protein